MVAICDGFNGFWIVDGIRAVGGVRVAWGDKRRKNTGSLASYGGTGAIYYSFYSSQSWKIPHLYCQKIWHSGGKYYRKNEGEGREKWDEIIF